MKHRLLLWEFIALAVLSTTLTSVSASDGGLFGRWGESTKPCNCPSSPYCPDDYCRKPDPRIPCPTGGCFSDCFVRKPLPCPPRCIGSVTCDDYARKCPPQEQCPYRPCPTSANYYAKAHGVGLPAVRRSAGLSVARN